MRIIRRIIISLLVCCMIAVAGVWWILSYVRPDVTLDMNYEPIDVSDKAMEMVKRLKLEIILTEADVNHLIKKNINRELHDDIYLDGAAFHLEQDRLLANLNVTYRGKMKIALLAVYSLEWQESTIVLHPESLSVKDVTLPMFLLEEIEIPLDLPETDKVFVEYVTFDTDEIRIKFKLALFSWK